MKAMEKKDSTKLDPNMPIVVRLDMRSGSSFVKGLKKPFDKIFTTAMLETAKALAEQVQGTQLVYTGSDEITLLLFNNSKKEHFTPFFEGKLQKMVSLTAAIATAEFNKAWYDESNKFLDHLYKPTSDDYSRWHLWRSHIHLVACEWCYKKFGTNVRSKPFFTQATWKCQNKRHAKNVTKYWKRLAS